MDPNTPTAPSPADPAAFIARWQKSGAAERANYQIFLSELCDVLGVPRPDPTTPDDEANAYVFERPVTFHHGDGTTSTGRIDLYRRNGFVCEAKQGAHAVAPAPLREIRSLPPSRKGMARRGSVAWDDAMLRARGQAEQYARALPTTEGRPPFLLVVDVGHSIELYSEFSRTGGTYTPFPAAGSHRIFLADLDKPETRALLARIWTDPLELDPARRAARVTREIAAHLAALAVSLEAAGHPPQAAAAFLMRALFTMFAEDVGLLLKGGFTRLLESLLDTPEQFVPMVEELWDRMDRGGFSVTLRINVLQFNGGLFADAKALPLDRDQLALLVEASRCDWQDVEPAIFGTLLERALDPIERHKLGAHYTPRAYVERLVLPTVVAPLRAEWDASRAAAVALANEGNIAKAAVEVRRFHRQLCETRILDPACGTGNFLYVTLEHLKRIEGEVFDTLNSLGERQAVLEMAGETVDPHQLLGLEINPRAAAIAELVLWIGTLQWHFRNHGSVRPPQPIIRNFKNIECRDALIAYDHVEPVLDAAGQPVTRWDGRTTKPHPVTGREVPDESARTPVVRYINPRSAAWPAADYVVGNPPFIGN
ncbi:MAG: type IIL restriction-modification enzyme MmeI, partial [Kiritimatiellia bacterium]